MYIFGFFYFSFLIILIVLRIIQDFLSYESPFPTSFRSVHRASLEQLQRCKALFLLLIFALQQLLPSQLFTPPSQLAILQEFTGLLRNHIHFFLVPIPILISPLEFKF